MGMFWEGVVLMAVGMPTVFLFLLFLVGLMGLSAKLFEGCDDGERDDAGGHPEDGAVIAAIIAAKLKNSS